MKTHARSGWLTRLLCGVALLPIAITASACGQSGTQERGDARSPTASIAPSQAVDSASDNDTGATVRVVVAPTVRSADQGLVLDAFQRASEQGVRDFGLRASRPVTIYIDPDSSIGLEDSLGLSARYAIHLRASKARRMDTLLPLMMHEYTHVLQYEIGRLRPQWWIEGAADHQAQRVIDPGKAQQTRAALFRQLGSDVTSNRAPALAELCTSTGWDAYVQRSGAGRAYGWGHAAVAFIENGWGFDAVVRIMTDRVGQNTMGSFDDAVQRETGLTPAAFETALRSWLRAQA